MGVDEDKHDAVADGGGSDLWHGVRLCWQAGQLLRGHHTAHLLPRRDSHEAPQDVHPPPHHFIPYRW